MIIAADTSIAMATLILAFLIPHITSNTELLLLLLLISALRSIGTGIQTPAVSAIIPELVPENSYMHINGINATIQSVVQFAAPAAGVHYAFSDRYLRNLLIADAGNYDIFRHRPDFPWFVCKEKNLVENKISAVYNKITYKHKF